MEINNEVLSHLLSSGGGAGAVAGAAYMAIRRIITRLDKAESKIDILENSNAKLEAKLEFLQRGK